MISTRIRAAGVASATAVLLFAGAACGGGGSSSSAGAEELSATLAIISTNIETAQAAGSFEPATEGEQLGVGDQVKTDPTGFAEITYHDGSWQRIENNATLTIDELTQSGDTNTVRTSIDIGQSWNRVQKLTEPDDAYELDTPVATATVRGTAFATDCPTATECTFSVIEGTVVVTPTTGDPVTLTAGQQVTVTANTPPPAPTTPGVTTLSTEPFIAKNLELDTNKQAGNTTDNDTEGTEGAAAAEQPLDLASVNPCVLEPAEIVVLKQLNPDSLGDFGATYGPGVPVASSVFPRCDYEETLPDSEGFPKTVFAIGIRRSGTESLCIVEHRGLCVVPAFIVGEEPPTAFVVPDSIAQAMKDRLGS